MTGEQPSRGRREVLFSFLEQNQNRFMGNRVRKLSPSFRVKSMPAEGSPLFVVRDPDGAAADEFPDHGVTGNEAAGRKLLVRETFHRFKQRLHPVVTDGRIEKARVRREILRRGQQTPGAEEERLERGQIEGKSAVDDMIGQ